METGLMTSPEILPYWNPTYYVIIENDQRIFCKYGELAGFNRDYLGGNWFSEEKPENLMDPTRLLESLYM